MKTRMNTNEKIKLKNIILGLLVMIFFTGLNAQQKVILEYKNGKTVEGTIKKFKSDAKTIKIKDKNKKKIKVKSSELSKITLIFGKEKAVFKKEKWSRLTAFNKLKKQKKAIWLSEFYNSKAISGYIGYSNYNTWNNMGNLGLMSRENSSVNYFIKRPRDSRPILIAENLSENDPFHALDKTMRKKFKSLIKKKCPEFVKILKKKKYHIEEFETMLDDYTKTCGK